MFPVHGIFFDGKTADDLFNYIKNDIVSILNEYNLYKTVKVINFAFKNSKLEQEMIFCYLKEMISKQTDPKNIPSDEAEIVMMREKISVLLEKMKPDYWERRIEEVFEGTVPSEARDSLIDLMVLSVVNRMPALEASISKKAAQLKK